MHRKTWRKRAQTLMAGRDGKLGCLQLREGDDLSLFTVELVILFGTFLLVRVCVGFVGCLMGEREVCEDCCIFCVAELLLNRGAQSGEGLDILHHLNLRVASKSPVCLFKSLGLWFCEVGMVQI